MNYLAFFVWLFVAIIVFSGCEESKQDKSILSLAELIQIDAWYWPEELNIQITDKGVIIKTFAADSMHIPIIRWIHFYTPNSSEDVLSDFEGYSTYSKIIHDNKLKANDSYDFIVKISFVPTIGRNWSHSEIWGKD